MGPKPCHTGSRLRAESRIKAGLVCWVLAYSIVAIIVCSAQAALQLRACTPRGGCWGKDVFWAQRISFDVPRNSIENPTVVLDIHREAQRMERLHHFVHRQERKLGARGGNPLAKGIWQLRTDAFPYGLHRPFGLSFRT